MNNKIVITVIIKNIVVLICFTILAIIFKIWWIALCSAFFLTKITTEEDK